MIDRRTYIDQHNYGEGATALAMAYVDEVSGRRLDASMGG